MAIHTPAPYEIALEDFAADWVVGRVIEHHATGVLVQIRESRDHGFWVFSLTADGKRRQRSCVAPKGWQSTNEWDDGSRIEKAFNLAPVAVCTQWHYVEPRPGRESEVARSTEAGK